ncbi:MAG: gluconolaconase [Polaromonas sp.]|nr:gluconolaconase [Polaromonas sp.]
MHPFTRSSLTRPLPWLVAAPLLLAAQFTLAGAGDIAFRANTAYPEGVAWSARQATFLVGSIRHGTIARVSPHGRYTPFIRDAALISSTGLFLDARRNTLWVANGDVGGSVRSSAATQGKLAAVAAYDATTGERKAYHRLDPLVPGAHFANDLTLDAAGNVYVTDSFSPVIYRIDSAGKASVFVQDPRFTGEGFNLNGIVYHPDGYLLVNKHNSGELFRISLSEPPEITAVQLPEALKGADGMVWRAPGRLTLVQNGEANRAVELVSSDGWKSARIQGTRKSSHPFPTAAAVAGREVYILNARLDSLLSPDAPKVSDFVLQKY